MGKNTTDFSVCGLPIILLSNYFNILYESK